METKKIVLTKVEKAEYGGKEYRKITDMEGHTWNVRDGKNGCLKKKWGQLDQSVGKEITLKMGDFEGKPYVSDIDLPDLPVSQSRYTDRGDSIEEQVAVKGIIDLWIADKIDEENALVKNLKVWLDIRMSRAIKKSVETIEQLF